MGEWHRVRLALYRLAEDAVEAGDKDAASEAMRLLESLHAWSPGERPDWTEFWSRIRRLQSRVHARLNRGVNRG